MGDPDYGFGVRQPGGWIYNILPYVGLDMIHDKGKGLADTGSSGSTNPAVNKYYALAEAKSAAIPFLICPTRRKPIAFPQNQVSWNCANPTSCSKTDYAANGGSNHFEGTGPGYVPAFSGSCHQLFPNCGWSNADQSSFNGVEGERSEVQPSDITNGLSNVFFAGDKYLQADLYYTASDPADDDCVLQGNDRDTNRWVYQAPMRDVAGVQQEFCFGSAQRHGRELRLLRRSRGVPKLSDQFHYVSDSRRPQLSRGQPRQHVVGQLLRTPQDSPWS